MKLLVIGILILLVAVPSVMAHPVIVDTYPPRLTPHTHEDAFALGEFITIVIGIIVITMIITVLVVYREDIISIKKQ